MRRLLLIILLFLFILQCSKAPLPEQSEHIRILNEVLEQSEYIRVLDEVPLQIRELESVTVFDGKAEPEYFIELISEQTYGETGEPYLTEISESVVDNQGRIIISDANRFSSKLPFMFTVYVYNADGSYRTQIGNKGRGPGEYGMVLGLQAKAEKVFVLDYTNLRFNIYNTEDYSFEQQTLIEDFRDNESTQDLDFGYFEARSDGNIIMIFYNLGSGTGRLENTYLLMDIYGNVLNFKPLSFPYVLKIPVNATSPRPSGPLLFMGKTITTLSKEDKLYSVWNRDFLIKKFDAKGIYQSAIYYPIQGSPFDLNEYTKTAGPFSPQVHQIERAFNDMNEELPETFPVIDKLLVDDENRIWVAVPMGVQSENHEWWILEESGELLAKLVHPKDQPIYDIKNGYLYSKAINQETGTEYVVKYRIEFTEK